MNYTQDLQGLQGYVENVSDLNPEILLFSINLPDEDGLKVFVSNDIEILGCNSSSYNYESYNNSIGNKEEAIYYIADSW